MTKSTYVLCVLFICSSVQLHAQSLNTFFEETNQFFSAHVNNQSLDYETVKRNPTALNNLSQQIASAKLESLTEAEQKAFLINAYNLLVVQSVVEQYPIPSPQAIGGFFDQAKHIIAGKTYTLNDFERTELLDRFNDPRLHFVLVCAAKSCPPIIPGAYLPNTLEGQLETQTQKALNDPVFIRLEEERGAANVSQIFDWYKKDFTTTGKSVLEYINDYRETPIPANYSIKHYTYDWALNDVRDVQANSDSNSGEEPITPPVSNVQLFTPSVLLSKGQYQVKFFNNLYTQTRFRDGDRESVDLNERQSFYTGIIQIDLGVGKSSRINVGLELNINSVRYDTDPESSPLRIFSSGGETLDFRRTELGTIGPRIRVSPFKSIPKFSFTSTLLFPLHNDLESPRFLAHNRVTWFTQFFYDKFFGTDFQLFSEIDFLFRFPTDNPSFTQDAFFRIPLTVFFSYFPSSKTTVNVNLQYSPAFSGLPGNDADLDFSLDRWFMQGGVGFKYQLTKELNVELLYTNFFASKNEGAGQTFNIGFVFIR